MSEVSPSSVPGGEESPDDPRSPRPISVSQLAMMGIAFLATAYLLINFTGDLASWHLAAAQEHNLQRDRDDKNGELKLAIQAIDSAIEEDPKNLLYLQQRSLWRRDAGDYDGALADLRAIEELLPVGDEGFQARISVLQLRGLIYQRQGKHVEAVAEQTQMIERLDRHYEGGKTLDAYQEAMSLALNNRAYFRAIANFGRADLAEALQDINLSLKLAGHEDGGGRAVRADDEAVKRDTRGYLHYLLGDYDGALEDIERAILVAENTFAIERVYVMNESRTVVDRRPIDLHMRGSEENLAVLYHHRGLIYEKIGRRYDAQVEFDRARRLGYNPARGVF